MSYDHFKAKNNADMEAAPKKPAFKENQRYIEIIGDPCYRFKRISKEIFFKNPLYRRVFLHAYFFINA